MKLQFLIFVVFALSLAAIGQCPATSPVPVSVMAGQSVQLTTTCPNPSWTVACTPLSPGQRCDPGTIDASGNYTAPQRVPQNLKNGCQVYPDNNAYNVPVNSWPVHPLSDTWITRVGSQAPTQSGYHTARLASPPRFFFGLGELPTDASTPKQLIHSHLSWCLSCQDTMMPMLQPPLVEMQSGWSMSPWGFNNGHGTGPDRHMLQRDTSNCTGYEYYQLTPDSHNTRFTTGNPTYVDFDTNQIRTLPNPQSMQVNGATGSCTSINFNGAATSTFMMPVVSQTPTSGYAWHVKLQIPYNSSACTAANFSNAWLAGSSSNDPLMNVGSLLISTPTDNSMYGGPDAGGSSLAQTSGEEQEWKNNVDNNIIDPACNCVTAWHHAQGFALGNESISSRILPPATLFASGPHPLIGITCTPGNPTLCKSTLNLATSGWDACEKPTPWLSLSPTNCQYAHIAFMGLTGSWATLNDTADLTKAYCIKMVTDTFHFQLYQNGPDCSSSLLTPIDSSTWGAGTWNTTTLISFQWAPYGMRVRLKASFNVEGLCVNTVAGCLYAKAVLRSWQTYGLVLLDGTSLGDQWDTRFLTNGLNLDDGVNAASIIVKAASLYPFENNVEVVDPVGTQPNWTPTIISTANNQAGMTNQGRIVATASSAAGNSAVDINVQGTGIGIYPATKLIAPGQTFTPKIWVTGTANQNYNCIGVGATVTANGTIIAPSQTELNGVMRRATMKCSAAGNLNASASMDIWFVPYSDGNAIRLVSGLLGLSVTDSTLGHHVWYGQAVNRGAGNGSYGPTGMGWAIPGSAYAPIYGTYNIFKNDCLSAPDANIYGSSLSMANDIMYNLSVPNGTYNVKWIGEAGAENNGANENVYDVEINGQTVMSMQDGYVLSGNSGYSCKGYTRTALATVSDGNLYIAFRQRVGSNQSPLGMSISGLEIAPTGSGPGAPTSLSAVPQ